MENWIATMARIRDITVIGSVNIDLVMETERLPREGETVRGDVFRVEPGGKGANQAVAAARLGAKVKFIGCVGDDEYGRMARQNLVKHGIDVSGLSTVPDRTGVALIFVDREGRNQIGVTPGANSRTRAVGKHDIVVTQLETPFSLPEAGTVILNPAPARQVPLKGIDVVIPNEVEAAAITGMEDPAEAARELVRMGAGHAIVTLGKQGVYDEGMKPAFVVEPRDTVGAGDTFVGAFAAALARGDRNPVLFAQAAAALKCTRPGAQNIPSLEEVASWLGASKNEP